MPLPPSSRSTRRACVPAVIVGAALSLLLGACGTTRQAPQVPQVPQPPLLPGAVEPAAPPPGAVPGAAPGPSGPANNQSVQALLSRSDISVRLIDAGRALHLWPWAAPFLQATGQRERILADIARARATLGPIQGRSRSGAQGVQMVRLGPESQTPPPGLYANVEYTAQRVDGGTAIERLSFRQESDGWRFTGYTALTVSDEPAAAPAPAAAPGASPRR